MHVRFPLFVAALTLMACGPTSRGSDAGPADTDSGVTDAGASYEAATSTATRDLAPTTSPATLAAVQASNATFALKLAAAVALPGENLVVSPWSISSALAMTSAGAKGTTQSQMQQALQFGVPDADLHPAMDAVLLDLQKRDIAPHPYMQHDSSVTLRSVNSLWAQREAEFQTPFLDLVARNYGAPTFRIDFAADPALAAKSINGWISGATNGNIPKLIDTLPPSTSLVLANAVFFEGSWIEQFSDSGTKATFHAPAGDVQAFTMYLRTTLRYAEGAGWQLTELPYDGGKLAMTLVLPAAGRFDEISTRVDGTWLAQSLAATTDGDVTVHFPRFSFSSRRELKAPLQALGMTDAFGPQADFSGISTTQHLGIGQVLHQAFISVDALGTRAAAATTVIMAGSVPTPAVHEFSADRPFLFFIRDLPTGTILFAGRVMDPTKG